MAAPLRIHKTGELNAETRKSLMSRAYADDRQAFEIAEKIIERVRVEGKAAVLDLTRQFDKCDISEIVLSQSDWKAADSVSADVKRAFTRAHENITAFHSLQKENLTERNAKISGSLLGFKYEPVDTAAFYVPGGKANYPSSVIMGLVPAMLAGVKNRLVVTPPDSSGKLTPEVLFCARLAGATEIVTAGGAQAIAALGYGNTAPGITLQPAQVIVGPGNRYVTAAKSILASRGMVRIDSPAGPSEVLVIADDTARADYVAADLLSQAEHGEDSMAVLCCLSEAFANEVNAQIEHGFQTRPDRRAMKESSIRNHSYAVVCRDIREAIEFSNEFAPEHLEICTRDPESDFKHVKSAGSVFLGHNAPVALGDYFSGTNHILPTGGAAQAYSGLGVDFFLKRITYQMPTRESLRESLEPIQIMSRVEGLHTEHGYSVEIRFKDP